MTIKRMETMKADFIAALRIAMGLSRLADGHPATPRPTPHGAAESPPSVRT